LNNPLKYVDPSGHVVAIEGMSSSDLANIKLDEIDSERGWIKMKGKGAKERVVRIGATTQKALWRYLIFREKNKCEQLWITEEGKPMKVGGIQIMKRFSSRTRIVRTMSAVRSLSSSRLFFTRVSNDVNSD
jgi:site-specific recombinase XerD